MSNEPGSPRESRVKRYGKVDEKQPLLNERLSRRSKDYEQSKNEVQIYVEKSMRGWIDSLDNERYASEKKIAGAVIPIIQEDTWQELSTAFSACPGKDKRKYQKAVDPAKLTLFVMLSNLFNREDEKVETALARSASGESVDDGEIVNVLMEKGLAVMVNDGGKNVRVNPSEYLEAVYTLSSEAGLDETQIFKIKEVVEGIISSQIDGLKMLRTDYSVDDAIRYKKETVGEYYKLLASFIPGSIDMKIMDELVKEYMFQQHLDDSQDILEDVGSQPNPYVAFLRRHSLMDDFVESDSHFELFIHTMGVSMDVANEGLAIEKLYA